MLAGQSYKVHERKVPTYAFDRGPVKKTLNKYGAWFDSEQYTKEPKETQLDGRQERPLYSIS